MKPRQNIHLLLLCAGSLAALQPAQAQNRFFSSFRNQGQAPASFATPQWKTPSLKTTAIQQRVTGRSIYDHTATPPVRYDSARYVYGSNNRGSSFDYSFMEDQLPVPVAATDSTLYWSQDLNGVYRLIQQYNYSYDAQNKVVDERFYNYVPTPNTAERTVYAFNPAGQVTHEVLLQLNGSSWDTASRTFHAYNPQGKTVSDSILRYNGVNLWEHTRKNIYAYNAAGNLVRQLWLGLNASNFDTVEILDFSYYPDNRLKTRLNSNNGWGGAVEPAMKDSLGYSGSGVSSSYHFRQFYHSGSGTWKPIRLIRKHFNSQNLPDTVYSSADDLFQPAPYDTVMMVHTYNSYNNPQSISVFIRNGGVFNTLSDLIRYYYEEHQPTTPTGIVAGTAIEADFRLYPNPVQELLTIRWKNGQAANTVVTLDITDLSGRSVHRETLPWRSETQHFKLSHLAPGAYVLRIANSAGQPLFQQRIVKN